jgi:CheY-like chemotaxis protein
MRALIVDDNSTTPGVLREMLCRLGMKPTCVESGTGSAGFLGELWPLLPADFRRWPNAGHGWIRSDRGDPEITGFLRMHHHDADFRALGIAAYLVKAIHQSRTAGGHLPWHFGETWGRERCATGHQAQSARGWQQMANSVPEDNAVNRVLAVRLLEKRGHAVTIARDGNEALMAARKEEFDVILMDIQMPDVNGFQATAAIRKREASTGGMSPLWR